MIAFYVFLLVVAGLGAVVYLTVFMSHVPGAKEERLGTLEPLPAHLGTWVREETPDASGRWRETRHLLKEKNGLGTNDLILQVRYRDAATEEIVEIEPERLVPRKRVRV